MMENIFAKNLKDVRIRRGVSKAELARVIVNWFSRISKFENSQTLPTVEEYHKLCNFFGMQLIPNNYTIKYQFKYGRNTIVKIIKKEDPSEPSTINDNSTFSHNHTHKHTHKHQHKTTDQISTPHKTTDQISTPPVYINMRNDEFQLLTLFRSIKDEKNRKIMLELCKTFSNEVNK